VSRPLLDLSRVELQAYLRSLGVAWLNDPSNEVTAFERVRLRRQAPARQALGLQDAGLARTAQRMARANSALEHMAGEVLRERVEHDANLRYGIFTWDRSLAELPEDIAIRVLRRVIRSLGGQVDCPGLGQTEKLFEDMVAADFRGATLAGCRFMPCQRQGGTQVLLFRESGRSALPQVRLRAPTVVVWDRRFRITFRKGAEDGGVATVASVAASLPAVQKVSSAPALAGCGMPAEALQTLPGLYAGGQIVAVPTLGWCLPGYRMEAEFIVKNLLSSGQP